MERVICVRTECVFSSRLRRFAAMRVIRQQNTVVFDPIGCIVLLSAVLACAGCSQNPYLAGGGQSVWQPPNPGGGLTAVQAQVSELNRRVQLLDDNNRQLTTQLAQREQQAQVYREELKLVRSQLADTASQYEAARIAAA